LLILSKLIWITNLQAFHHTKQNGLVIRIFELVI
jgi:hypothetical protein